MSLDGSRVFKAETAVEWTAERIDGLTVREIQQLQENAERLNETGVAELCAQALKGVRRPRIAARGKPLPRALARRLIARPSAFQARGIYLVDRRTSWSGVRKSDGGIVFALWAAHVVAADGGCRYLLWAPNADGSRPWSDKSGGRERLEHCKKALECGHAEGLLVYGEALEGALPEDRAHSIHGADADTVLHLRVELVDQVYWAVWGKATRQ